MEHCVFCGANLPRNAQFCGVCGNVPPSIHRDAPTSLSDYPSLNNPVDIEDTPTVITGPVYPSPMGQQHDDITIRYPGFSGVANRSSSPGNVNVGGMNPITDPNSARELAFSTLPITPGNADGEKDEEEEERRRALFLGIPLLSLLGSVQPPTGNVPMVQGTPQIGSVPMVQTGGPSLPMGPTGAPGIPNVGGSGLSPYTTPTAPLSQTSPWSPPSHPVTPPSTGTSPSPGTSPTSGSGSPSPSPSSGGTTPHPKPGCAIIIISSLVLIVIIASLLGGFFFLLPTPTLSGTTDVFSGTSEHIHGSGFISGASVTFWLDDHFPLVPAAHSSTGPLHAVATNRPAPTSLMLLGELAAPADSSLTVNGNGTFDVTIPVNNTWPIGKHSIVAREVVIGIGLHNATFNFRIDTNPTMLLVSPNVFANPSDTNCTYNVGLGWTCTETLSSSVTSLENLNWTASSSGINGITFSPTNGMLSPGQTAHVTVSIPNTICPAKADFIFNGPGNKSDAQWSCAAPALAVTSNVTNLNNGCLSCTVTLSLAKGSQGGLNWSTSSSNITGVTFLPAQGSVYANMPVSVTVTVPNTTCPPTANFLFKGPANTAQVTWSCVPPKLSVSPSQLTNTDCSYSQGWSCTVVLTNQDTLRTLNWSASSSGINGITFSPMTTSIQPSGTATVNVIIPNTACPITANLVFKGPLNTVQVPWSCQPPALTASPGSFLANNDCKYNPGQNWICTVSVTNPDTQLSLNWSASDSGITFNPTSGTLPAGQTKQVSVVVPNGTCPASTSFTFTGPSNTVTINWRCAAPTLSLNSDLSCSYSSGWTCLQSIISNTSNEGNLSWNTSSSGISGISFKSSSGVLAPGVSVQVTITIPYVICPSSATLQFKGPANTLSVPWSCSTPALTVTPTSFYTLDDCQSNDSGWVCVLSLSSSTNNQGGLNWSVSSSNAGITFDNSSGTLSPGGTPAKVNITVIAQYCPSNPTLSSSVSGSNPVDVAWSC